MARQTIVSTLLAKRKKLNPSNQRNLLVRGGGIQIDDSLARHGWQAPEPILATVITSNPDSGAVTGARFETRGTLVNVIKFKAEELWEGALRGASVTIAFNDLSIVEWNTSGNARNQSRWLDGSELEIKITKDDGSEIVSQEEKDDASIGGLCVRFTVHIFTVDKAILNAGISPQSKQELEVKLQTLNKEMSSPFIPTIALKLAVVKAKPQNGLVIKFGPTEEPGDKFGLGHLPLLEVIGAGQPTLPDHDLVEQEMVELMRGLVATNNVLPARLPSLFSEATFPSSTSGSIAMEWAAYRGPVVGETRAEPGDATDLDDSMLGGADDDEISGLLDQINAEAPGRTANNMEQEQEEPSMRDPPNQVGGDAWSLVLAQQNERQNQMQEMMVAQGQFQSQMLEKFISLHQPSAPERDAEKRKANDVSYLPQDHVMIDENYHIKDDGAETLDTMLRQRLRQPNADPVKWWKRGAFKQVDRPILGGVLYTKHIIGSNPAESTICKHYDVASHREIKNYLTRNSGVMTESKKKIKLYNLGSEDVSMGVQTNWENASTVWEVMDAAFNLLAVEHMVRPYSYGAIAMMSCCHECRYFCGVAKSPKQQRMLLENFFNECFKENRAAGREGRGPQTLAECHKTATAVLAAAKVTAFSNYYSGDPYLGNQSETLKKKDDEIKSLEAEVKALKNQLKQRSGGRGGNNRDGGPESAEDKRSRTCQNWNTKGCSRPGRDGHCGWGSGSLKHGCAKLLSGSQICWSTDHKEKDCTRK